MTNRIFIVSDKPYTMKFFGAPAHASLTIA